MNLPSIHPHTNLETLLDGLLDSLQRGQEAKKANAALKPVPIIVPSFQFTGWLQVAIAKRNGLCMGLEFMMPQTFIERALTLSNSKVNRAKNPWTKENLTWRLLPHIKDYAQELGVENPSPRDRLALAGLLADQFDQYAHFRPEIIMKWDQGDSAAQVSWTKTDKENEKWQRELWLKACEEINNSETPQAHPALMLKELSENEGFLKSLKDSFPQLFVVGTGALDPLLVKVLQLLGKADCDVQAHLALPSLGYLGGLRKSSRQIRRDPETFEMSEGHPLLVSMGRHAVGSFLLLGELDENYSHWPEPAEHANEAPPSSLLGCLQSDIRQIEEPSGSCVYPNDDLSLRVHSCYGARREMEVLRDELLRAFDDITGLKPDEVIVVTPSLETYAPLVAAVLEQSPALPVRLTELPPSEQDPTSEGLLALLEMTGGRCEASSLLELLHLRAVRTCLEIADDSSKLERLRDWIYQSGLTHGLDDGEPPVAATGSWRFARDRMIAGRWFGSEAIAQYPDTNYVLPIAEDLGGEPALKQAFLLWHWQLERTLLEWRSEAVPAVWSERLGDACDQLLSSPGDEDARLEMQPALNFLAHVDCTEPVDAAALFDWLQGEYVESGRRTTVSGRITFGRLKQLQSIPCRVLAMVGMQEGTFPRQNRIPAWDLLHLDPRAWDRNARIDDRQLFLDAVLTPSDRLIITASNRNVRSGKSEPLSACVDELLRVAQATVQAGGKKKIEPIKHQLQPFAPGYFKPNGDSLPRSFDSNSAKVAESFLKSALESRLNSPFWNPESQFVETRQDEAREITLDQLVNFWKDPAAAFLREQGIMLGRDEENDEALDRSPLKLDGLQNWNVKSAIVQNILDDGLPLDYTKALLAANRALPSSELGKRHWELLRATAEPLANKIRECITERLSLDFLVPGRTPPVRIIGTVLRGNVEGREVLLSYRTGKFKTKYYLQPWIQAITAACAGHSFDSCILDEETLESRLLNKAYDTKQAQELLSSLIKGFLQGQSRPLCYAPDTSRVYAEACQLWEAGSDEPALGKASGEWNKEAYNHQGGGEGQAPAVALAWRDQDPFVHDELWHQWARDVAKPLQTWIKTELTD